MLKIINFIVLLLFISTFTSNYSYSNKPVNKGNDKLALMRGLAREEACDILFNDLDEIIEFSSGKTGRELADELVDTYSRIKDATDIIKKIDIKSEDKENGIRLIIKIQTENKNYTNEITIHKEAGIIWDKTNKEIIELCDKLAKVGSYIYLRAINNRLHEYYDKEKLNDSDIETLFSVLKTIEPKIEAFKHISPKNFSKNDKQSEKLLNQYLQTVRIIFRNIWNRNLYKIRAKKFINPLINTLTTIRKKKGIETSLNQKLIYNLIFLYDKKNIDAESIKNLENIAKELMKKSNKFDKPRRSLNLGWIASIFIRQKQLKNQGIIINSIIKNLDKKLESRSMVFIKRKILGSLGSIAHDLIEKGHHKIAYNSIITRLQQIAEDPNYEVPVRTKAMGQLFGRGSQLVKKATEVKEKGNYNYNEYLQYVPKITTSIKITDAKTTNRVIIRKCIAEVGAILLAYERFWPDSASIKNLEEYITQFENDPDEDGIEVGATARRILKDLAAIRKKRKEEAREQIKKAEKRKQKEKRKKLEERELKKQKKLRDLKRRYKRRIKDTRIRHRDPELIIDTKIRSITKKLMGRNYLKSIQEDKYLTQNYMENIVPRIEYFINLNLDTIHNPFEKFTEPIVNLQKELSNAGKNKNHKNLITILFNTNEKKLSERKEKRLNNCVTAYIEESAFLEELDEKLSEILEPQNLLNDLSEYVYLIQYYISRVESKAAPAKHQFIFKKTFLEKINLIQEKLEEKGEKNTEEYQTLVKIKEKYNVHVVFKETKWGVLERLEELKLITIDRKNGYVIKNVNNWPTNIEYHVIGNMEYPENSPEFKSEEYRIDDMSYFDYLLEILRYKCDRIRLDIILDPTEKYNNYGLFIFDIDNKNITDTKALLPHVKTQVETLVSRNTELEFINSSNVKGVDNYVGDILKLHDITKLNSMRIFMIIETCINQLSGLSPVSLLINETDPEKLKSNFLEYNKFMLIEKKYFQNCLNRTEDKQNNVREILLIMAVESNDYKKIKKDIDENVCLDIWKEDGTTLFDIAANIAIKDKDYRVFDLLVSEISISPIFNSEFKFDENVKKLKNDIKKSIMRLYKPEIVFLWRRGIKIDYIKDFDKLKRSRKLNNLKRFINPYILAIRFKNFMLKKAKLIKTIRLLINKSLYPEKLKLEKLKKSLNKLIKNPIDDIENKPNDLPVHLRILNYIGILNIPEPNKTKRTRAELDKAPINKLNNEIRILENLINIFSELVNHMYDKPEYTIPSLEALESLKQAV